MGEGGEGASFSHGRAWATNVQAALLAQGVQEALPALGSVEGQSAHSHQLSGQGRASSSHSRSSHKVSRRHSRQDWEDQTSRVYTIQYVQGPACRAMQLSGKTQH